jgi:hypothetical protein
VGLNSIAQPLLGCQCARWSQVRMPNAICMVLSHALVNGVGGSLSHRRQCHLQVTEVVLCTTF